MSIVTDNGVIVNGRSICNGTPFFPIDSDSAYASYQLGRLGVGVTYETGTKSPWLRLCPGVQIPEGGAREEFGRWCFEQDDERFMDLKLDKKDGEVTMHVSLPRRDLESAERGLAEALRFLDRVFFPAFMGLVAKHV